MFRSRWCILVAVAGLALSYPVEHRAYAQTSTSEGGKQAESNTQPTNLAAVENGLNRIASEIESSHREPQTETGQTQSQRDLAAQEGMWRWAKIAAFVAAVMAVFTGIGLFLIWQTLESTKDAARHAGEMAREAEKATAAAITAAQAATNANDLASDTAKRQLRAYVIGKDHRVTSFFAGGRPTFSVNIHNFGQTPAYEVRCRSLVRCTDMDVDAYRFLMREADVIEGMSNSVIGPQDFQVHHNAMQAGLAHDAWEMLVRGEIRLIYAGIITYRDAFGRRRLSSFRYYLNPAGNIKDTCFDLLACGKGNKAN